VINKIIAIVVLSLAIIMAMPYAQQGLDGLLFLHNWVSDMLTEVFKGSEAGDTTRALISLLAIPVAIGLIPAAIYWLLKRSWFPYFMQCVWVVWLIQTSALVVLSKI